MLAAADHISAVKRSFESRAMPETEKPPARLVDIYSFVRFMFSSIRKTNNRL